MSKLDNSLILLRILLERDIVSSKELSTRLNVTDRQLRIYITSLKQAGFNINSKTGVNGGYYLTTDKCPLCFQKLK